MHLKHPAPSPFETGVFMLSLDCEGMWGHFDYLTEREFNRSYPDAAEAPDRMLRCLGQAEISATWAVVGGLALARCLGPADPWLAGLPPDWVAKIPAGVEQESSVWYRRSLVQRIARAHPAHDVGLHGGLTHLPWTEDCATTEVLQNEIRSGIRALVDLGIRPVSFVYPRNQVAHLKILAEAGIRCFRGPEPDWAGRAGRGLAGAMIRVAFELGERTPPPVAPEEVLPGLWNIPASLFLYPMSQARLKLVPLKTRLRRVRLGLEAAARQRGIFHLWLHPANVVESSPAFAVFESIIEEAARWRNAGDITVMNMAQAASRMEQLREPAAEPRYGSAVPR